MGCKPASFNNHFINTLAPLIGSSRISVPKNSDGLFRSVIYIRYDFSSELKRKTGSNNRFKSEAARAKNVPS